MTDTDSNDVIRFTCVYPMAGDLAPLDWCDAVLGFHKRSGELKNYRYLGNSGFGGADVAFTIDLTLAQLGLEKFPMSNEAINLASNILGGWINDVDHEVISAGVLFND